MITSKENEKLKKWVSTFVAELEGRYREHISDDCLVQTLLMLFRMCKPYDETVSRMLLEGLSAEAYTPGCKMFETILEYGCRAGGNGHHVAQSLVRSLRKQMDAELAVVK